MNMSMNLIAILVSLAMMLTGAGGDGQPAEAARTLILRDISLTVNGEQVALEPTLRLGVSTDGQKALYDFGLDAGGETLMPVQLLVEESGVTALFDKSDTVVGVTAAALEKLTESVSALPTDAGESSALLDTLSNDFFPAYIALMTALQDESFQEEFTAGAEKIFDGIINRGEGTPVTEEVEGESYELTEYSYTIEADKLAELCDAVMTSNDTVRAYYDAMFRMYAEMPEEAGMSGIASYADLFEKTGIGMKMDIVEKRSEDGEVVVSDMVMTMDMGEMIARMTAAGTETETAAEGETEAASEAVEMTPVVMNVHSTKAGKRQIGTADMEFEASAGEEKIGMYMSMRATQDESALNLDMTMSLTTDGADAGFVRVSVGQGDAEDGATHEHAELELDMGEQGSFRFAFEGTEAADGAAEGAFQTAFDMNGSSYGLDFTAEIATGDIEDRVSGREAELVIDDLSDEGMAALGENEAFTAAAGKISMSMLGDAQALMSNESVQALTALFVPATGEETADESEFTAEEDVALDEEGDYEIDLSELEALDDGDFDIEIEGLDDFEEIEDDGVLGFEVPQLSYLPGGWIVDSHNEDTAYDWADITVKGEDGSEMLYAVFFADEEDAQVNYIVADNGTIAPVEGREISVVDFGDGTLSVTMREAKLYCNLLFYSDKVDMDTVGKIIAGIQF